jgi:AAA15 family ATPase/GTPase
MKLKNLHIDSYRHLENLHFDFTYQEGHEKAGKPLEKICIIGQSATGKTSLLELVRDCFLELDSLYVLGNKFSSISNNLIGPNFKGYLEYSFNNTHLKIEENKITSNKKEYSYVNSFEEWIAESKFINTGLKLIYLSSEIISKEAIETLNKNPLDIFNSIQFMRDTLDISINEERNYLYQFSQNSDDKIWVTTLNKILNYRKKFTQMLSQLLSKGVIGDINKLNKEFEKWSVTNKNPLINFSNHFNPILNKLNLEIDLVNTEYTIPIKSKMHDEVIPISSLSTGTKSLLLSMFPVYELDTKDAIILIDEPERSLFPDMQIDLISHYQNLAPKAQFIVATHSPFIAAAFEPEERFILYFDEKGKVAVLKGESPIGDDPNDILHNDFNVNYYNEFGKAAHKKYLDLKREVYNETKPERKKELIVELAVIGDKYNF